MADLQRSSPLLASAVPIATHGFSMREMEGVSKLRVQVLRNRGLYTPAVSPENLPDKPNTTLGTNPIALWRAPDDWLVYSGAMTPEALDDWVAAILSDAPLVATNVSSASTVLELSGARVIDVLMRDCTLDLEGNAVPPGECAQTQFAQVSVLLHRVDEDIWRLFVERSVAQHVWEWLADTVSLRARRSHIQ